eukprot:29248_5
MKRKVGKDLREGVRNVRKLVSDTGWEILIFLKIRDFTKSRIFQNVYSQLSGLEDVVDDDLIEDDFIPEGDGQVASGSAS